MFSPFGTPTYANTGAADSAFGTYVSNCVGVMTNNPAAYTARTFTATDGGSSLTLAAFLATSMGDFGLLLTSMIGSVNLAVGDILTISQIISGSGGTGTNASATLVDEEGNIIEVVSNTTGADLVFSAAPFTGNYVVILTGGQEFPPLYGDVTVNFVLTSSGTMTVNPVAALVDSGTGCPYVYDC